MSDLVRLRTIEDLERLIKETAAEFGRNPNYVWRDVLRRTDAGLLVLRLLDVPLSALDLPSQNGRGRPKEADRNYAIAARVRFLRDPAQKSPLTMAEAIKKVACEFDLRPASVRQSLARNPDAEAKHFFDDLNATEIEVVWRFR